MQYVTVFLIVLIFTGYALAGGDKNSTKVTKPSTAVTEKMASQPLPEKAIKKITKAELEKRMRILDASITPTTKQMSGMYTMCYYSGGPRPTQSIVCTECRKTSIYYGSYQVTDINRCIRLCLRIKRYYPGIEISVDNSAFCAHCNSQRAEDLVMKHPTRDLWSKAITSDQKPVGVCMKTRLPFEDTERRVLVNSDAVLAFGSLLLGENKYLSFHARWKALRETLDNLETITGVEIEDMGK